jgi:AcrR family transcriptional regulator
MERAKGFNHTLRSMERRRAGTRVGLRKPKIISTAARLFEKNGTLTIEPIAKAFRVSSTGIRFHFPGGIEQIRSEIARAELDRTVPAYKLRQSPEDFLIQMFWNVLERVGRRRHVAGLIPSELFRDPILSPLLAERILVCVSGLGAPDSYLPRGLQRVIAALSEMVLVECTESDEANRAARANHMTKSILYLPHHEYPMLRGNSKLLTDYARFSAPLPSPTTAREYALATIDSLRREIEAESISDEIEDKNTT